MTRAREFEIPRRLSLSAQSAAAIRKAIADGVWRESLPSERRLCDTFQVSRPTIRTALQQLQAEGLLEIKQGRRMRLLAAANHRRGGPSRLVVLVTHQPIAQAPVTAYQSISEMRAHLSENGFTTEVLVCPAGRASVQRRKLQAFVRENRVAGCVLLSVSREVQEWFDRRSVPALVLGSCHPAVNLPSLDIDYRAVCRHAAGVLRSRGHRRVAFIVPDSGVAGDLASEAGFREGCAGPAGSAAAAARIIRHASTAASLTAKLDPLFASAEPPTGVLVAKSADLLKVMVFFLKRGIRVPDAVSLIARDWDHLFDRSIAHYRFEDEAFARRLSRLMSRLVSDGRLRPKPHLVFPRYVAGDAVKDLRTRLCP